MTPMTDEQTASTLFDALAEARQAVAERDARIAELERVKVALAGAVHFSDAVAYRDDTLSKCLREWLQEGAAALQEIDNDG